MNPTIGAFRPGKTLRTIDAHTEGEPLRVIIEGLPHIPGDTILAKRRWAQEHLDGLRQTLMLEPRGHADMYGCILTEPSTEDGDTGVLFLHNGGFSTMCGHGIIGLVKVGLDCGLLSIETARAAQHGIRIDTPAGRVVATPELAADGTVASVSFENVPSFLLHRDLEIETALGTVVCDIAFGGAFYAYLDARTLDLELTPENQAQIIEKAMTIKRAVMEQQPLHHPSGDADLEFLYGVILVECPPAQGGDNHSRNVCVFADGEVDRCPTGTGVSGRAAIHCARGELALGETITIESLIGTSFDVTALRQCRVGELDAIVPRVSGRAFITGRHEFVVDPMDPLASGFLLR
jgi:trans-L-3-hydroxyproline dehydratase